MKKKTRVYIDGNNLYYGLLKNTPWKWLDLPAFVAELVGPDHEIVAVNYFTAPIKTYPYDPAAIERQNVYIQALSTRPVKTTLGFYSKNAVVMPAYEQTCKECQQPKDGMLRVVKLEEKRSDVNIAVAMMLDAAKTETDCFVLITGDSDQVGTIEALRYDYGKTVLVFNPHAGMSDHLKRAASYYKNIPRDLPSRFQLPDSIPVGKKGNFIRRPAAWK